MELVKGAELKDPLPAEDPIGIVRQIAAGLEAAHDKGITHHDLSLADGQSIGDRHGRGGPDDGRLLVTMDSVFARANERLPLVWHVPATSSRT